MKRTTWLATGLATLVAAVGWAGYPVSQSLVAESPAEVAPVWTNPVEAAYIEIWNGFHGPGKRKTLYKVSSALNEKGKPDYTVNETNDNVSLMIRLGVDSVAFEAWRRDAHQRLAALGPAQCTPVPLGTETSRIIGGRAFRFCDEGEACVKRWETDPRTQATPIAIRVEGFTAKGKKVGRWEAPLRLFRRAETNAYPRPLLNMNRLLDIPPSIWEWTKMEPKFYAATETAEYSMPLTALSPRRAATIDHVQCTVMDAEDFMPELLETADPIILKLDEDMIRLQGQKFLINRYEVKQELWDVVMETNPSKFKGPDLPVDNVSWDDCQQFLIKLNAIPIIRLRGFVYRFPKEDEWEYACRAGSQGDFCRLADGTEVTAETLEEVAWYRGNSEQQTHPPGEKEPNAFGLYDMHGNVWEWTSTEEDIFRVTKGGGWDGEASRCESGNRNCFYPGHRFPFLGLRLVR